MTTYLRTENFLFSRGEICRWRAFFLFLSISLFLSPVFVRAAEISPDPANSLVADADAVNLIIDKHYRLEENGNSRLRLYLKRRIMSYKGKKDHADFKYTYNQAWESVTINQTRTLSEDGRVFTPGPKEIHDIPAPWQSEVSRYSQLRQRVISLPAVEPGSTVEIDLTIENRRPLFFQEEYFRLYDPIINKKVSFDCPAGLSLRSLLPRTVDLEFFEKTKAEGRRIYCWQGRNINARSRESLAAPASLSGSTLKITSAADWREIGKYFQSLLPPGKAAAMTAVNHPTGRTTAAAEGIYRRLSRLKCFDLPLDDSDWQAQAADITRQLGYGSSLDLALLFLDELQQSGYQGELLLARAPDNGLSAPDFPWPGGWDLPVVLVEDEFFRFSPADPAPGITGLDKVAALMPRNGSRLMIADLRPALSLSELNLSLNDQLHLTGRFNLHCQGATASEERQKWRDLAPAEKEIAGRRLLHRIAPRAQARGPLKISGLDRQTATAENFRIELAIDIDVSTGIKQTPDGRQLLIPLPEPDFLADYLRLLQKRENPLLLAESQQFKEIIRLQLPVLYKVIEPAVNDLKQFSCRGLESKVSCRLDANQLIWERYIKLKKSLLAPESSAYHNFVAGIRRLAERENLRLLIELPADSYQTGK